VLGDVCERLGNDKVGAGLDLPGESLRGHVHRDALGCAQGQLLDASRQPASGESVRNDPVGELAKLGVGLLGLDAAQEKPGPDGGPSSTAS